MDDKKGDAMNQIPQNRDPQRITCTEAYRIIREYTQAHPEVVDHVSESAALVKALPMSTSDTIHKIVLSEVLIGHLEYYYHESDGIQKMSAYAHLALDNSDWGYATTQGSGNKRGIIPRDFIKLQKTAFWQSLTPSMQAYIEKRYTIPDPDALDERLSATIASILLETGLVEATHIQTSLPEGYIGLCLPEHRRNMALAYIHAPAHMRSQVVVLIEDKVTVVIPSPKWSNEPLLPEQDWSALDTFDDESDVMIGSSTYKANQLLVAFAESREELRAFRIRCKSDFTHARDLLKAVAEQNRAHLTG